MNTLKYLIYTILFVTTTAVASAQDQNYRNLEFIENKGQWDSKVRYKAEVDAGAVFIRSTGFTILQHNREDYAVVEAFMHHPSDNTLAQLKRADGSVVLRSHAYNVDFVGASPGVQVSADKAVDSYNNYFIGTDPSKWGAGCRIFQGITLSEVYPNVDVRYYTYNGALKYDIIAKPGADIKKIALRYEGADKLGVKNRELIIKTSIGELKEEMPYVYLSDGKQRREVSCKYVVKDNVVRFDVKDYDPNSTLVIDPTPIFCSLSGSTADNWGFTATYGPDGSFYGGGIVFGNGFPVTAGAFQTTFQTNGGQRPYDMGIIKLRANGGGPPLYATYIGGATGNDQPHSLIVDGQGNLVIAGRSNASDYPVTGTPLPAGGDWEIVVTKLNSTGTGLIGSKRIGGSGADGLNIKNDRVGSQSLEQNYGDDGRSEVILDGGGNIYVASCTRSSDFPIVGGFQNASAGQQDAVLLKLAPDVSSIIFSTYMGGGKNDAAYVLALAPNGDIYVGGGTESNDFLQATPKGAVGAAFHGDPNLNDIDGFVARISNNGATAISAAYIGTAAIDQVYGVQFDRNGFPYIMGQTRGTWQVVNAGYSNPGGKQFIAKLQPDLSAYIYSTMFGSGAMSPNISPTAFLVDRCENVYVSGWGGPVNPGNTYGSGGTNGMPVTPDALKPATDGEDFYFFVLRRDAVGPDPLYASYFGQNGGFTDHVDGGTSRFDANGVIYQSACANCGGGVPYPTTPGAWVTLKPASAYCNLGMLKLAFNLAGVGSNVSSAIGGVPNDTAGCFPLDVVFTDQVRNATEYIWNFGEGDPDVGPLPAATGYTQSNTFELPGVYQVMLVAINPASCNVRDTSYISIRVGDLRADLAADFIKLGDCSSLNYQFNNLTPPTARPFTNTSFIWDFGDGSPRITAGTAPVTHTFPAPGPYIVKLILNDTAFCNHPDSIELDVRVATNVDARFSTDPGGCSPYEAEFTNESDGGVTYLWDFGDPGSPDNTSTDPNPTHVYNNPGTYIVTFTVTDPFTCNVTDVETRTITVQDGPIASFSFTPSTPIVNTPNVFTNLSSTNATRFKWVWEPGDSTETTSRADITHQFNRTGTFNVCLIAYNDFGCSDTFCLPVPVIIEPALGVPNAFTPGRGDNNSIVRVEGFGIGKMKFIIYNRWGQKVFETSNRNQGWDGKYNGVMQPMDVYAYTLEVEFTDGTKASKKGDITLIR